MKKSLLPLILVLSLVILGCDSTKKTPKAENQSVALAAESAAYRPLFNGKDLTGWQYKPGTWKAEGGSLIRVGGGDIWTIDQFGDFILELDFRTWGNSGIFIRTGDIKDSVQTGIEIQVIGPEAKESPKHSCGAVYDALAPSAMACKPAGQWNNAIITAKGNLITVVMNGQPIINMNLDQWSTAHKNPDGTPNKFNLPLKDFPRKGYIGLQEHGSKVEYRNIRLKSL